MNKKALVAIGYNNGNGIKRLLYSLENAYYGNDTVTLIISIDKSDSNEVEKIAELFHWSHGEKKIRTFSERQGLRKHILSCGDFFDQYDSLFIFEDDIVVSPYFYEYGKKCINYYWGRPAVEGISLYSHKWNQNANFPFEPIKKEFDTYYAQYAPSWGQIWFRETWMNFMEWYGENQNIFEDKYNPEIPYNLYQWGKNSWLKYYIAYCALKKRYFVYPYFSYTTAFVTKSTHFINDITRYQVSLAFGKTDNIRLAPFDENAVYYDAFFENIDLGKKIDCEKYNVCIDLYGTKRNYSEFSYILSTQILPYKVRKKYSLQFWPVDMNIIMSEQEGEGIYLYDTQWTEKVKWKKKNEQIVRKWNYFMRDRFLTVEEIWPVCSQKIQNLLRIIVRKGNY